MGGRLVPVGVKLTPQETELVRLHSSVTRGDKIQAIKDGNRRGGLSSSSAKVAAARENGCKGGRPKGSFGIEGRLMRGQITFAEARMLRHEI